MKKLLVVVLAIALLAGCGKAAKTPDKNAEGSPSSENNVLSEKPAKSENAPQKKTGGKDGKTQKFIDEESIRNMVTLLLDGAEIKKMEREFDDGVWKYEVDAIHLGMKYEFEFNAETGEVIKFESESIKD